MNITVNLNTEEPTDFTGGEHAISKLDIYVDPSLPDRTQKGLIVHSIVENFNRNWSHTKVEELCELIQHGLDEWQDASDG